MEDRDINRIRETIAKAKAHEQSTSLLAKQFGDSIERLHDAIELPEDNKVAALMNFVIHYIEHVPDFIEAISNITHEAGIDDYSDTFMSIARDYFLKPPETVDAHDHKGLLALMDEAYLAHRLVEEINDRLIGQIGIPLAPMDMTRANIIIHHLIGEPFANELDLAVHYSVESLMPKEKVFQSEVFQSYIDEHKKRGWSSELERWPCLANDLSITLRFEDKDPKHTAGPHLH